MIDIFGDNVSKRITPRLVRPKIYAMCHEITFVLNLFTMILIVMLHDYTKKPSLYKLSLAIIFTVRLSAVVLDREEGYLCQRELS